MSGTSSPTPGGLPPTDSLPPLAPKKPSSAPGLSRGAKAGIVAGVAVAVLLAAIAAGAIPGLSFGSGGSGSSAVSSSSAEASAAPVASAHDAGALVAIVGIAPTVSFTIPNETGNGTCPLADAYDKNISVPSAGSGYSGGSGTLWAFAYYNAGADSESVVLVVAGTPYFLGTESGASCVGTISAHALPSSFISSAQAASAADADAGGFLHAHAQANGLFVLENNGTGAAWEIVYTNCSYDPSTGNASGGPLGDLFVGEVNASAPTVLASADLPGGANCSAISGLLGGGSTYALGMIEVSSFTSGPTYTVVLALTPTSGLTTGMFGLDLQNAAHATLPAATVPAGCTYGALPTGCTNGTGWYAVLVSGGTGKVIGTYGNATPEWGNLGPGAVPASITSADDLWIVTDSDLAGSGDLLSAFGIGSASVSGGISF